jgi:hypothetical protein
MTNIGAPTAGSRKRDRKLNPQCFRFRETKQQPEIALVNLWVT